MKRIAGNDLLELLSIGIADDRTNPARIMHHDLRVQDQRAKLVFDFLRAWGFAAAFGEMAQGLCSESGDDSAKRARIPPTDLAIRACEIVDAAWSELTHRGWIVSQPSLSEED